jgi:hypothetical protein
LPYLILGTPISRAVISPGQTNYIIAARQHEPHIQETLKAKEKTQVVTIEKWHRLEIEKKKDTVKPVGEKPVMLYMNPRNGRYKD